MLRYLSLLFVCLAVRGQNIATQAEYDLYSAVAKDFAANQFKQALTDLDIWSAKYPQTNVENPPRFLYVQAHWSLGDAQKAMDTAVPLLQLEEPLPGSPVDHARLLYIVASAVQRLAKPTETQLDLARKAAARLLAWEAAPAGVAPETWPAMRRDLVAAANSALRFIDFNGIAHALTKADCELAHTRAKAALTAYPESGQAAWYVGAAAQCMYRAQPSPSAATLMLFEYARAASLDPSVASIDPKWQSATVRPHFENLYNKYHGDDAEGLAALRELATKTTLPPTDFVVLSSAEIDEKRRATLIKENPELALWTQIREALDKQGVFYFETELQGTALPPLKGVVIDAQPACRPLKLLVAVTGGAAPEVELRFEKPLTGKVEPGPVRWEGVGVVFTPDPFLLSMDAELEKVEGLKIIPCGR